MRNETNGSDDGHAASANVAEGRVPSSSPESGEAKIRLPSPLLNIEQTIANIRYWHRQRCYAMEQRKRADLSLGAFLRTALGWSKALPEAQRNDIAKRAAALIAIGEAQAKGKDKMGELVYEEWKDVILASIAARAPFDTIEKRACKQMGNLAKTLPVYPWAEAIRGFGDVSLAVIVAEAGDLATYATHSKLWKRMGVAVMGDVRQGGLAKNASKDDWIEHGYNRQRRARLWNIGDSLIKGNRDGKYRVLYLERKAYELAREPEMQPIKAHRRAQRYMEKRLLRDLWRAWRNGQEACQGLPEMAWFNVPPVQQNERKANSALPERATG